MPVKILHGIDAPPAPPLPDLVLGIGIFDGVHRGHQALLARVVREAAERRGAAGALTFHPHPLTVLTPARAPRLLVSLEHRLRLLERIGVGVTVVAPFTTTLASVEAETFVADILIGQLGAHRIVTGEAFRFGRGGRGDIGLLKAIAGRHGVAVESVPPVTQDGEAISSTVIREAIERGDLSRAAVLLGRPVSVLGRVTEGSGRGRRLGFPTANLLVDEEVAPPRGVYAVSVERDDGVSYRGVANVGVRPTFAESRLHPLVEAHLFGCSELMYGRTLEVSFVDKLRDERLFAGPEALAAQIARDIEQAHRVFDGSSIAPSR